MQARWQWVALQFTRQLWVRATLFAVLAVATALVAAVLEPYVPEPLVGKVGTEAVDHVLDILASSMLAVTTFSLSVMVSAYGAATSNVTPRATRLLMADTTTHNVLSTFIGSFLFSLVGIVALSTGVYGEGGRVVLFAVTLLVITLIVVMLLRWIDHLSRLGRVGETSSEVEKAAAKAIAERIDSPWLGGRPLTDAKAEIPASARAVYADVIGYVQHLDVGALQKRTQEHGGAVYVGALPGAFVHQARPVAWVDARLPKDEDEKVAAAFTVGAERSFDQDPRYGISVLSEIASRALSPGINDPGTAIDIVGRMVRLLSRWADVHGKDVSEVQHPAVWVPPVLARELFDDAFTPIARDADGTVEVHIRLQKALLALSTLNSDMQANAQRHAALALKRAEGSLSLPEDLSVVRAVAEQVLHKPAVGQASQGIALADGAAP